MSSWNHDSLVRAARRIALMCAVAVALIGVATLLGWISGVSLVTRVVPSSVAMKADTAIALLLLGLALGAHAAPPRRRWVAAGARVAGWAAALLVAISALQGIVAADFGIDQLLFADPAGGAAPGRPTPVTCAGILLVAVALEIDRRRAIDGRLVNAVVGLPLLVGLVSLTGYLSGITSFTGLDGALRLAPTTGAALVLAGVAVLLARPQRSMVRLLVSPGPGGLIARRLLPIAVGLPLVLDGLRLEVVHYGLLGERIGDWVFAFLILTIMAGLVLRLGRGLDLLDLGRRSAEDRMARVVAAHAAIAAGSGELSETVDLVAAQAAEIVGADGAVVELPDGEDMVYRAVAGAATLHLGLRIARAGSLAGTALASGATLHCADAETDPRVDAESCRRIGLRSMICVPLRHGADAIGVLKVYATRPGAFGQRDERTLELLGGLAASTVHRAQVEQRLAAHYAAGDALAGARSLEVGLAGALRGIGEQLGWGLAAVWLPNPVTGALACVSTWRGGGVEAGAYLALTAAPETPASGGLLATVCDTGEPAWLEHLDVAPERSPDPRRAGAAAASGLRTLVAVPIISRGETLGVVELACGSERTHDAATIELVTDIAKQIGQFVQRRRAEDRMAVQAANLAAVAELSQGLSVVDDPSATRPALCSAICDLARADQVMLLEPDGAGRLVVTAEAGGLLPFDISLDLASDTAMAIEVFHRGEGRFVPDFEVETTHARELQRAAGLRSAHYEPLVRDGAVTGVLFIATLALRTSDEGGVGALMRLLAAETASALAFSDLLSTLDRRARTDELTGVANRRTWEQELPLELARAARLGRPISMAIIDLDHFKAYNDTFGHPAGDRLLRATAASWADRLRATDLLARYGGEEFAVLLPGCDASSTARVAEALRAAVPDQATCSIGVATWDGQESAEQLVARADTALYAAKDGGRDRVAAAR